MAGMTDERLPPGVDPSLPSPARVYDFLLGGTENLEVDRQTVQHLLQLEPDLPDGAWANRGFLQRATRWMAEAGIDQFIDIGAGLPTRNNTHDAARAVLPDARVVYVDNDPMAVTHGRKLLADVPNVVYVENDFHDVEGVLRDSAVADLIDLERPVGLLAVALLHFVPDAAQPRELLWRYLDAVPSGSYLAISHATADYQSEQKVNEAKRIYAEASDRIRLRSRAEVSDLFQGLELVSPYEGAAPAVTWVSLWGAEDPEAADSDGGRLGYAGVARKP